MSKIMKNFTAADMKGKGSKASPAVEKKKVAEEPKPVEEVKAAKEEVAFEPEAADVDVKAVEPE
jgi:hypothetical protein